MPADTPGSRRHAWPQIWVAVQRRRHRERWTDQAGWSSDTVDISLPLTVRFDAAELWVRGARQQLAPAGATRGLQDGATLDAWL